MIIDFHTHVFPKSLAERAVEKGITNGTGGDAFSPGGTCTRGQIVTFLFRAGK